MADAVAFDRLLLGLVAALLAATVAVYLADPVWFHEVYAAEDGPVEYATAGFLLLAGLILLARARRGRGAGAVALTLLYALMFLFAAGEEISWGQRIVGWDSGAFFIRHNRQGETNFHNLVIGKVHLAKTVFGNLLTPVLLAYLVVLPVLYGRLGAVRRLAGALAVPVPGPRHAALAVLASAVVAGIDVPRKWEVYELVFALLACSVFVLPQNRAGPGQGGRRRIG